MSKKKSKKIKRNMVWIEVSCEEAEAVVNFLSHKRMIYELYRKGQEYNEQKEIEIQRRERRSHRPSNKRRS